MLVSQGEMHLFPDMQSVGIFPDRCTTVAAKSRQDLRKFRSLDRQPVTIAGRRLVWPGGSTVSLTIGGSRVPNLCNSELVIVATSIVPVNRTSVK